MSLQGMHAELEGYQNMISLTTNGLYACITSQAAKQQLRVPCRDGKVMHQGRQGMLTQTATAWIVTELLPRQC